MGNNDRCLVCGKTLKKGSQIYQVCYDHIRHMAKVRQEEVRNYARDFSAEIKSLKREYAYLVTIIVSFAVISFFLATSFPFNAETLFYIIALGFAIIGIYLISAYYRKRESREKIYHTWILKKLALPHDKEMDLPKELQP